MQVKRILSAILLIVIYCCGCKEDEISIEPVDNSFVFLRRSDSKEFCVLYADLNKITPKDFLSSSVGKKERLDLINKRREVTFDEFDKLRDMGNLFFIEGNQANYDIVKLTQQKNSNKLRFNELPENQKGSVLKYLYDKGYYVIFKEYRGDYVIIPMSKKEE